MSELRIMNGSGDTKLEWEVDTIPECEEAQRQFEEHVQKGYLAYRCKKDGSNGEMITEFDKTAERIIMAPPMSGG